ncbi:signaling-associated PDZ domain-containing protein [Yamadazyma tenuis ATCC 10573]|uniref:Pro-apoptotic serine protease NMA111 n=1 Tax=Candida tenuis (strain ATCC 10573 / BCRC 21748 / CBS 615 / JCM 9827 / NBRC 10315 / NRRL Y-1498 / VKM Y-70) TaxID=590646 RepID=G3BF33_CANTC|nr:signaling-associated PDZ domain-containing protein [Yamadazyma tenuis ATCC 10573]EGV60621.1 signaling-associated PDZ domain-containing protein [Yamadazyma tenuis ATCC 10573]
MTNPSLSTKRRRSEISTGIPSETDPKRFNGQIKSDMEEDTQSYYSDTDSQIPSTITKVVKSVVSIQFSHVANFDTETAIVSEATGFVVDNQRGLILTNRHVVGPGPFWGYAVFDNHEEAVVKPIYRDPIHDFGFLQFDPSDIKHMELSQLELRPDLGTVGTEIRVVGNDAGEKLSILSGFISRSDRNAPDYGSLTYNDFNTEYIQAAASATGGSSGSPVINEDGYSIALQAGGPLRALKCIQQQLPITRGDIQVEWQLKPYDECRRLGLTPEVEAKQRELFPEKIGMLVAELILPEGPADGLIKEGDTLISINDEPICTFIKVDEILDESVGKDLTFVIQRGGTELTQTIKIGDLHAITPDRYVEVAGASFNTLSYQIARCYCMPVRGVYINNASGSFELSPFEKNGWLLESVDDKPTPDLDTFVEVMKSIPDLDKVVITYRHVSDMHSELFRVVYIDRHWCSTFRLAQRNDETGLWDYKTIQENPIPPTQPTPKYAKFIDIPFIDESRSECSKMVRSFVQISAYCPISLDSHPYKKLIGHGVIVDAANGYVLVSRRNIPHDLCDVLIIFAESIDVPGKVVFLHPHQNYAIVKYDPSLITADVRTPKFGSKPLKRGETSLFVGYNYNMRLVTEDVKVSGVSSLNIPAAVYSPRYRGTNLQCILLDSKLSQECYTGILCDDDGTVRAFWLTYLGETNREVDADKTYRMGLDVTDVLEVIELLQKNEIPKHLNIIDAEFTSATVFQGRTRGISQEWITKFEEACEDEISFLVVDRIVASPLDQAPIPLKTGDVLLSINDKLVKEMRDLNIMYESDNIKFKVVRQKKEIELVVPTVDTDALNTTHVLFWCGASIQAPHHGVRQQMERIPSEVYITSRGSGAPAQQYDLAPISFITHVNDKETKDMVSFINVIKGIPDQTYVKIRLVSFDNIPIAISMKTNYHYFPTSEFKKLDSKWESIEHN